MTKLSKAQQKMVDRLKIGKSFIGYGRYWYTYHTTKSGERSHGLTSKANRSTIDALLAAGILVEKGTHADTSYAVELREDYEELIHASKKSSH